jgi:putative PIN family toxin of toxin-antitoxin system
VLRAVLDANVVVSALIRPDGVPGRVLVLGIRGERLRLVLSPSILAEIRRTLTYPKVRHLITLTDEELDVWVDALALVADVVPDDRDLRVVAADPDDDKYVAAAIEGRASYVVSGDRHLLEVGSFQDVRMISPRAFLDLLESGASGA